MNKDDRPSPPTKTTIFIGGADWSGAIDASKLAAINAGSWVGDPITSGMRLTGSFEEDGEVGVAFAIGVPKCGAFEALALQSSPLAFGHLIVGSIAWLALDLGHSRFDAPVGRLACDVGAIAFFDAAQERTLTRAKFLFVDGSSIKVRRDVKLAPDWVERFARETSRLPFLIEQSDVDAAVAVGSTRFTTQRLVRRADMRAIADARL